jgi:hypothetical protein
MVVYGAMKMCADNFMRQPKLPAAWQGHLSLRHSVGRLNGLMYTQRGGLASRPADCQAVTASHSFKFRQALYAIVV